MHDYILSKLTSLVAYKNSICSRPSSSSSSQKASPYRYRITERKLERRAKGATSMMMKILVLNMLLVVAVHADTDPPPPPPSSIDSPPSDLLLLPQFLPLAVDPSTQPYLSCRDQCSIDCATRRGLRRLICSYTCLLIVCRMVPSYGCAGHNCAQACYIKNLRLLPNLENVDGMVDACYSNCTEHFQRLFNTKKKGY